MSTKSVKSFLFFFMFFAIFFLSFAHTEESAHDKIYLSEDAIRIIDNQLVVELQRGKKTATAVYTDEIGLYVLSSDLSEFIRMRKHVSKRKRFHEEMHKEEMERRRRLGINENYSDMWNTWNCEFCDYLNHNNENESLCSFCKRSRTQD